MFISTMHGYFSIGHENAILIVMVMKVPSPNRNLRQLNLVKLGVYIKSRLNIIMSNKKRMLLQQILRLCEGRVML